MSGAIERARNEGRQEGLREGRQEGLREGRQEGWREGARIALERQLQRRFGLLSPRVAERLRRASADDLATWVDQVLDADSLDEVFRPNR